jgi:7-carboxy-7-deazaguanine synthase
VSNLVPLAEHFHSIQGEGFWVGTPMHFIRVAGCAVGVKATSDFIGFNHGTIPILDNGLRGSKCKTYDGRYFDCDTDFSNHLKVPVQALVNETHEEHICLTGGEPLAYQKQPWFSEFLELAYGAHKQIHVETSGTVLLERGPWRSHLWIAVAPKHNYLPQMLVRADEIKFLVDEKFDMNLLPPDLDESSTHIYLCPINGEKEVSQRNVAICMHLLSSRPGWRLSAQWHKFIGVR